MCGGEMRRLAVCVYCENTFNLGDCAWRACLTSSAFHAVVPVAVVDNKFYRSSGNKGRDRDTVPTHVLPLLALYELPFACA